MFCVECGKEEQIYKNGVCLHCYLEQAQFTKGPAIIDIIACPRCESYKYKNTWLMEPFPEALRRHVKDAFHIDPELQAPRIETDCKEQDRTYACIVRITGSVGGQTVTEEHPLTVRLKRTTCDVCSREAGGYYEAILQIRSDKRTFSKTELQTLQETVERLVGQQQDSGKRGLFITDYEVKREGLDFFLSEKNTAFAIAKKIQEQYGGEFKQSASTAGMKDSRQLFRMTYLIRIPTYRTGDFLCLNDTFYMISSIHGTRVKAVELSGWKEKIIEGKDIQQPMILGGKELIKEMIVVSQSKHEIQLMDTKTYTTVEIPRPPTASIHTATVKTVKLEGSLFLYPETTG
jgi:nonsense-mediated mRNA decay protein 3